MAWLRRRPFFFSSSTEVTLAFSAFAALNKVFALISSGLILDCSLLPILAVSAVKTS
jgi:hypothetical protein